MSGGRIIFDKKHNIDFEKLHKDFYKLDFVEIISNNNTKIDVKDSCSFNTKDQDFIDFLEKQNFPFKLEK